jgi:hypothetical protein
VRSAVGYLYTQMVLPISADTFAAPRAPEPTDARRWRCDALGSELAGAHFAASCLQHPVKE